MAIRPRGASMPDGIMSRPAMARTLPYFYLAGATWSSPRWLCPTHRRAGGRAAGRGAGGTGHRCRPVRSCASDLPGLAIPIVLSLGRPLVTASGLAVRAIGSSFFGLFYLWVAVEAFYLLSRGAAALQMGLVAVAYAGVLAACSRRPPASALADGGGGGHRGGRARGLPARQDRRARGLARRRRPHRPADRPAQQARVRGAVRERARAGAPLGRTSIRAARRSRRLQGRERPLRARGGRRRAAPGGARTCSSGSAGWTRRPGSAARSSRCSCRRPTSAARSWWPSACAAPPTAASPRTRWA